MNCSKMLSMSVALLGISGMVWGQTVSVGAASSVQSGSTTTITVPVMVTGTTATASTGPAAILPMLNVQTPNYYAGQGVGPAFTTLVMSSVVTDTAKGWSPSTNTYTVPATGTYLIVSKVRLTDGMNPGVGYGQGVNTSNMDGTFFLWTTTQGLRNALMNTRLVQLTAGQTINLFAYVDTGSATVLQASLTIQELN